MKKINSKTILIKKIKIIFSIIILIFCTIFVFLGKSYSNVDISYKTIFTSKGDTLWSIAKKEVNNNSYYYDEDIRKVIYDLKKINNLDSDILKTGTKLEIPIYK